ncbi:MAG: hypothetical protein AAF658_18010, partial [Myxococcota bacterium]
IAIAEFLGVACGSVNRWLQAYDRSGLEGLPVKKPPGATLRLSSAQKRKLTRMVEDGPESHGSSTGIWTGPPPKSTGCARGFPRSKKAARCGGIGERSRCFKGNLA